MQVPVHVIVNRYDRLDRYCCRLTTGTKKCRYMYPFIQQLFLPASSYYFSALSILLQTYRYRYASSDFVDVEKFL
jgi:hypothetical protein